MTRGGSWLDRLCPPLAADEHRARFWHRHVLLGVGLTEVSAVLVLLYVLLADRPHQTLLIGLFAVVVVATPMLLLLPLERLCRDRRAALVMYGWSAGVILSITSAALLDGGADSPLVWLLVLSLTYAGLGYPPLGVALCGLAMEAAYLLLAVLAPAPRSQVAVVASVLATFIVMTVAGARNHWEWAARQTRLHAKLRVLADTDSLTGCLNRRAFTAQLREAVAAASPASPVSLCLLDLDGFKAVNDALGHAEGDRVLVEVAVALRQAVRAGEAVSRLGGDEFAVLLPATSHAEAEEAARRLQVLLSRCAGHGVTASAGTATTTRPGSEDDLASSADRAMYAQKSGARLAS